MVYLQDLDISEMPVYLGNFLDTQAFGKIPKFLGTWEISQKTYSFGKVPRYPGILEISQIPESI